VSELDVPALLAQLGSANIKYKKKRSGYDQVLTEIAFICNSLDYSISVLSPVRHSRFIAAIPIMTAYAKHYPVHNKLVRTSTFITLCDILSKGAPEPLPKDLKSFLTNHYPELLI